MTKRIQQMDSASELRTLLETTTGHLYQLYQNVITAEKRLSDLVKEGTNAAEIHAAQDHYTKCISTLNDTRSHGYKQLIKEAFRQIKIE